MNKYIKAMSLIVICGLIAHQGNLPAMYLNYDDIGPFFEHERSKRTADVNQARHECAQNGAKSLVYGAIPTAVLSVFLWGLGKKYGQDNKALELAGFSIVVPLMATIGYGIKSFEAYCNMRDLEKRANRTDQDMNSALSAIHYRAS